jgi:hypothetical protein
MPGIGSDLVWTDKRVHRSVDHSLTRFRRGTHVGRLPAQPRDVGLAQRVPASSMA